MISIPDSHGCLRQGTTVLCTFHRQVHSPERVVYCILSLSLYANNIAINTLSKEFDKGIGILNLD